MAMLRSLPIRLKRRVRPTYRRSVRKYQKRARSTMAPNWGRPHRFKSLLRSKVARLRGRYSRVRTRYPTAGAFASSMKIQTHDYYDNLTHNLNSTLQTLRTTGDCTGMFLSPYSVGQADRTLINTGTLLSCNIELTVRNMVPFQHQIRVSVVELITEDAAITSTTTPLDWLNTVHFNSFFKKQNCTVKDEETMPFIGANGPDGIVAQYAAINTNKFRILRTKWITMGTDQNGDAFKGIHFYVPIRRHIDKDAIVDSKTPRYGGNIDEERYAYAKPVFLLFESFVPPGATVSDPIATQFATISGKIKYAFKDK